MQQFRHFCLCSLFIEIKFRISLLFDAHGKTVLHQGSTVKGSHFAVYLGKIVTLSVTRNPDADTLSAPEVVIVPPVVVTQATMKPDAPQETPAGTDYVLNLNTKKFHYPSCSSVKQMKDKNKGFHIGTRDEVIAMGYKPCGNCHP